MVGDGMWYVFDGKKVVGGKVHPSIFYIWYCIYLEIL